MRSSRSCARVRSSRGCPSRTRRTRSSSKRRPSPPVGSPATTRRSTTASWGPWFVDTFLAASGLDALDYAVLLPDVDVCVERVMTRVDHGFRDEAAARKMHHEFSRAEIDARHVIVNHSTAESAADEIIARWEAGGLTLGS